TRTTWWRPSSRRWPGRCGRRWRRTRAPRAACRAPRGCWEDRAGAPVVGPGGAAHRWVGLAARAGGGPGGGGGDGAAGGAGGGRGDPVVVAGGRMSTPSVVVLDYGSGNLRSAQRALIRAGATVTVTSDLRPAADADGLVVPGVGAFAACLEGVRRLGADRVIVERVASGRPVLGICVGAQILFEYGDEHGTVTKGLGLLPGGVARLVAPRVPHMGWNTVAAAPG